MFQPKLITTLRHYNRAQFINDLLAGIIVGIVALPLAIAFGIASGVSPEKGLYTAVIAGFLVSALGGSKVQIGGPTGAFIVIVYGIIAQYGLDGLIIATFMAGILLIVMGLARLGSAIKFIPYPLIVGFTSGIALIIFSSQIKDLLGLETGSLPADFLGKWILYFQNLESINFSALAIALFTVFVILYFPRINRRIPGSVVAILITTLVTAYFQLPVETIGSRFGEITASFPKPDLPNINLEVIRELMLPAFTIALLGAIESLLSAVIADGMIGGQHRSNTELIAQGIANMASGFFGGIPATGAIARTTTNVKNGGRTPVAGIMHAVTLLLIVLFFGKLVKWIPMATLAGILLIVSYNMSEWRSFLSISKGPRGDFMVMLVTFLLTVLFDLTIAIEIGMVLAVFLFMHRMIRISKVEWITGRLHQTIPDDDPEATERLQIPAGVEVFEINGPLFFGASYKFRETMQILANSPKILIIRMRHVPTIDATGLHTIRQIFQDARQKGTKLIISGIQPEVAEQFQKARLTFLIGKKNVLPNIHLAILRSREILGDKEITPEDNLVPEEI